MASAITPNDRKSSRIYRLQAFEYQSKRAIEKPRSEP
jgi:hypothetical protein